MAHDGTSLSDKLLRAIASLWKSSHHTEKPDYVDTEHHSGDYKPGVRMLTQDGKNFYQDPATVKMNRGDRINERIKQRNNPPVDDGPMSDRAWGRIQDSVNAAIAAVHGPEFVAPPAVGSPNDPAYQANQRLQKTLANRNNPNYDPDKDQS